MGDDGSIAQQVPPPRAATDVETAHGASIVADLAWKPDELKLRRREVNNGQLTTWVQATATIVAAVAAFAAVSAARSATDAVRVSQESSNVQSLENRMATAIEAVGSDHPSGQIAGLAILNRTIHQSADQASDASPSEIVRARTLYLTGLQVAQGYAKSFVADVPVQGVSPASASEPLARPGNAEVGGSIRDLLRMKDQVIAMGGDRPNLDLAAVELAGVSWARTDLSWLAGRYLAGIDLRAANLTGSNFSSLQPNILGGQVAKTTLTSASLQCANLSHANLTEAVLTNADLRKAELSGANLSGADLTGANLSEATFFGATVSNESLSILTPDQRAQLAQPAPEKSGPGCKLSDQRYWRTATPPQGG